jgi:hypothetical protein
MAFISPILNMGDYFKKVSINSEKLIFSFQAVYTKSSTIALKFIKFSLAFII